MRKNSGEEKKKEFYHEYSPINKLRNKEIEKPPLNDTGYQRQFENTILKYKM